MVFHVIPDFVWIFDQPDLGPRFQKLDFKSSLMYQDRCDRVSQKLQDTCDDAAQHALARSSNIPKAEFHQEQSQVLSGGPMPITAGWQLLQPVAVPPIPLVVSRQEPPGHLQDLSSAK